jgi:hypothetical protein
MKFTIFSVLAFLATALAVQMPLKSVIVSYPDNTPNSVVDQAMDAIKSAGGMVRYFCFIHPYHMLQCHSRSNILDRPARDVLLRLFFLLTRGNVYVHSF